MCIYVVAGSIRSEHALCVCKYAAANAGHGLSISLCPGEDAEKQRVCQITESPKDEAGSISNASLKMLVGIS